MRAVFDNDEELKFFCQFITKKINDNIASYAEQWAIAQTIKVEPAFIEECILKYEGRE